MKPEKYGYYNCHDITDYFEEKYGVNISEIKDEHEFFSKEANEQIKLDLRGDSRAQLFGLDFFDYLDARCNGYLGTVMLNELPIGWLDEIGRKLMDDLEEEEIEVLIEW